MYTTPYIYDFFRNQTKQSFVRQIICLIIFASHIGFASSPIFEKISESPQEDYCTPSYFQQGAYTTSFVTTGGITNANYTATSQQGTQGYLDLSGDTSYNITQTAGLSFDFTHTFISGLLPNHTLRVWIDWNNDETFDDIDERVIDSYSVVGSQTGTISIPNDIQAGNYRMRIRSSSGTSAPNSCQLWDNGQAIDFTLVVQAQFSCSGTPTIGMANLTPTTANVNQTYNVSVENYPAETGLTFVWESSTDNWANITTEYTGNAYQSITRTALAPVGHQVKYRLKVTCSNSGETITSNEVTFTTVKEYCTPSYTSTDYHTSAFSTSVNGSTLANFTATGQTGTNGYNDLSGDVSYNTIQTAGESFNFSHTFAGDFFPGDNTLIIWIDWNDDGTFDDSGEQVFNNYTGMFSTQVTQTGTISIPTEVVPGNYRMRVRCQWANPNTTPCDERVYGQALDFTLVVNASSCIVNIPDANFKNALLAHSPAIDTNGDGEIQCTEAEVFTGLLNISGKGIADLTGIEAFVNITELNCFLNKLTALDVSNNTALTILVMDGSGPNFNQITALDVSNNTALTELQCEGNLLSNLDVSNNIALTKLICGGNPLTSLDVSSNTALTELQCQSNQLTSLDVSSNIVLTILNCSENQLTSLDVGSNTALTTLRCVGNQLTTLNVNSNTALLQLWCGENQLTSLDVSNNTALTWLICPDNQLTTLDTSNNTFLEYLLCNENQIISLDVSNNTTLKGVECNDNQLTFLNVKNGNNSNFLFFGATDNPNLYCIEVDNVAYSNVSWANFKDATACFSDVTCITPTFDLPTSVCQNAIAPVLPALSGNTVSGSWSPATIDTSVIGSQTYAFTPTLCANPYQITISVVTTPDAPTGEPSQTFIAGQTLADLIVNNGMNLVWSSSSTFSDTLSDSEPLVNGMTYYVRNEDGNCQSEALAITVTLTVNASNFDVFGFTYYPNPVNDILHFSSNQPIENVTISNMLAQEIKANLSSDKTNVDLSNLPSGNYLVKVTIEGVSKIFKIVKR